MLKVSSAVLLALFIAAAAPRPAMAEVGNVTPSALDSLEFDATHGRNPEITHISGDVYAVVYDRQGNDNDGWIFTQQIFDDGTISDSKIDSLEFDAENGLYPDIVRVSGPVHAIVYTGPGYDGLVVTVSIFDDGTIGDAVLDSFEFDAVSGIEPSIVHVAGDVFAIAYTGPGTDGWLATIQIASDGTIWGGTIDSFEFNTSRANNSKLIHISGDVFAIVYAGGGADGWIATVQIQPDGSIGGSTIDELEYDGSRGAEPDIIHVTGDIYAIAYSGPGADGWLCTVSIASDGAMGPAAEDSEEFDPSDAILPHIFHVSGQAYGVAYRGPGEGGWVVTYPIDEYGSISVVVDSYEFDAERGAEPWVAHVSGDVYAVAYSGLAGDGFIRTLEIETGAPVISVTVEKTTFAFGTKTLNSWLDADSTVVENDGTVAEDFCGRISQFSEGAGTWGISAANNGADIIRAQWSVSGPGGPWNDVPAYDTDFVFATDVAEGEGVTLWLRIMTPTSTSSFNEYSSTLTVTAQQH